METKQLPICRLFVVCADAVLHFPSQSDSHDGYWEVHNPMHTVWMPTGIVKSFGVHEMYVYIQLTNGLGVFNFGVTVEETDLANSKRDRLVARSSPMPVELADPWSVVQRVVELKEVAFPRPGLYRFRLMLDGKEFDGGVAYIRVMPGN